MSQRARDTTLASNFTHTKHSHPSPNIKPSSNPLPKPLNILIIGASRGIGAGIASAYAQAGAATLLLAARPSSQQELAIIEQTLHSLSPATKTQCFAVDITSSASVADLAHRVQNTVDRLDIVVLNSGYSGPVVLDMTTGSPSDFQNVFDVNVQGTYLVVHHLVPLLRRAEQGAKTLIVVSSLAACITDGHIANTAYCVSKMAQARLVEFVSEQFGGEGVLALGVHPGAVLTEMADSTTPESFRECGFDPFSLFLPP